MVSEEGFQVFYLVQNDGYLSWLLILAQGGFTRRSDQFSLEPSEGIQGNQERTKKRRIMNSVVQVIENVSLKQA